MNAQQWFSQGTLIEIEDKKIFVYDSGTIEKPVLLILHGYPTCSYDYYKALPYLEEYFRVVIHDHLGFGYSDKPINYSYSLIDQADFALLLWRKLRIKQAHLLAHDYGTSVATEIIARDNRLNLQGLSLDSVTLCNGSMHIELAHLRMIQKLLLNQLTGPIIAKLSNKNILKKNLQNIYYDKSLISDCEIEALWTMMNHNQGKLVLHKTTQYINERKRLWHRWIGALKQTTVSIHIVWAKNDPVAVIKIAETLHDEITHSNLTILDKLGHFPMLENPKKWSTAILKKLL